MKRFLLPFVLALGLVAYAQEDVTVNWVTGNTAQALELAQAAIDRYEAENPHTIDGQEYNVNVELIQGPESASDRFGLYLQFFEAQSSEADIYEIDVIWPGDLAEHLVDLSQYEGVSEAVEGHFDAIVENNTVNGKLVGIPFFTDAGLLYYRTDLIEQYSDQLTEAGLPEDPAEYTWANLEQAAQIIQEGEQSAGNANFTGFTWQGNSYEGLTCDALEWVASAGGGTIVSPEGEITVFNEDAIAAVEQAAGWVGTISPSGVTEFQEEDARRIWSAGNAAFMRNWPYAYSLSQAEDSPIAGNVGIAPLPAGESGDRAACLGGWQIAVSEYSSNPAVAADVALHLTSYDEQVQRAIEGSNLPTIEAVYEDEELLNSEVAWFADLLPVFRSATPRPSTVTAPNYNEVSRAFFTAVHDVLTGQADAEDSLAELELNLEDITGLPTGSP